MRQDRSAEQTPSRRCRVRPSPRASACRGPPLRFVALASTIALSCAHPFEVAKTPDRALVELDPSQFPAFSDDLDYAALDTAIDRSLQHFDKLAKSDPARRLTFGTEKVPASKVAATLRSFRALIADKPAPAALAAALRARFRVFQSSGNDSAREMLFTGYYLPELRASPTRSESFPWPLHGPPRDLVTVRSKDFPGLSEDVVGRVEHGTLKPYPTRAEITAGALPDDTAVAWVESAVDAFFLEIQGSGVLRYADGTTRTATFAGRNGRPYVAIGGELIRAGALTKESVSMQSIRAWLDAHPAERHAVMNANPSYVFFRLAGDALGSLSVPVTGGRSLATDFRVFPKGALCFVETTHPQPDGSARPVARFMLDQDTGGAIRTAGHVDFFLGAGRESAEIAGRMKQGGRLFYLLER